jgi:hypothetical protein
VGNCDDNDPVSPYPFPVAQNPAPAPLEGQEYNTQFQGLVNQIMATFLALLPDNYVSQVNGPFYTLQFQAIAEALAKIQLTAQQATLDSDHDFTRSEFLWQIIGTLVFPETDTGGIPTIDGDVCYRNFLKEMVRLLLQGSTLETVTEGVELISGLDVTILEKYLAARQPESLWGFDEQFQFEISVEQYGGTAFPENPFSTQENVLLVLEALKPAHTLWEYRHLFRDAFGPIFDDTADTALTWELSQYRYDDLRKFCYGAKEITSTVGRTLSGRYMFSDPTRSFESVAVGSVLLMDIGPNAGRYEVTQVVSFPVSEDATPRAYTTSPTGLSGTLRVSDGDTVTDTAQDWSLAVEGEILTITEGSNAGSFRLDSVLGSGGGVLGSVPAPTGPATEARITPSIVRVRPRMLVEATGQTYTLTVDRLGVREPKTITDEDASEQFYL